MDSSPSGLVTILHPHHPLYGQQVEVVRMRRGQDPDLIVRLPDGTRAAIAMSWTDYGALPPAEIRTEDLPLLDLEGLRQIVRLVEQIRDDGRDHRFTEEKRGGSSRGTGDAPAIHEGSH